MIDVTGDQRLVLTWDETPADGERVLVLHENLDRARILAWNGDGGWWVDGDGDIHDAEEWYIWMQPAVDD